MRGIGLDLPSEELSEHEVYHGHTPTYMPMPLEHSLWYRTAPTLDWDYRSIFGNCMCDKLFFCPHFLWPKLCGTGPDLSWVELILSIKYIMGIPQYTHHYCTYNVVCSDGVL